MATWKQVLILGTVLKTKVRRGSQGDVIWNFGSESDSLGPLSTQPGAWGKGAREGEMRVGEILDPLITLVVGYQASTDAVTIRKVGQCTTVQTRDTSETR
jgi:hypothetical protein